MNDANIEMQPGTGAPSSRDLAQSRLGIASFLIALVSLGMFPFGIVGLGLSFVGADLGSLRSTAWFGMVIAVGVVALGLGIASNRQRERKLKWGVIGVVLSLCALVPSIVLVAGVLAWGHSLDAAKG